MSELSKLIPIENKRVIDLVQKAGIDVSDWANCKRGRKGAASNPKYCYAWSFIEPGKFIIINLWHCEIKEQDETILRDLNMRDVAEKQRQAKKIKRQSRAVEMDHALQLAFKENLPVRVIICAPKNHRATSKPADDWTVGKRLLDPVSWTVTIYEFKTGECVVKRGNALSVRTLSQKEDRTASHDEEYLEGKRLVAERYFFARNSKLVRDAKAHYGCRCQVCGFAFEEFYGERGKGFIEVHHKEPLSERDESKWTEELITKLDGVTTLCANCHRMVHRKPALTVEELKRQIMERTAKLPGDCKS